MLRMVWFQTRKPQNAPSMVLVISIHILADSHQSVCQVPEITQYFAILLKKT